MTSRLELYNKALGHLGPVRLNTVTENRPDRYELDAVYDATRNFILESGLWFFALRTVQLEPDTDVEPGFGLPYVYTLPSDFVRLRLLSPDEHQTQEDRSFRREGAYLRSEYSRLYATFVSNDPAFGMNLGAWPEAVADAAGAELAYRSGLPITKDRGTKNDLLLIKKRVLVEAKRLNAVDERVKEKPLSSWARNRLVGSRSNDQRREST